MNEAEVPVHEVVAEADRVLGAISDLFATVQSVPRAGITDDIARAAVFLASDAASFITGQGLAIDGGLVPFGKYGWEESVELRAEIARRVRAQSGYTRPSRGPDVARTTGRCLRPAPRG